MPDVFARDRWEFNPRVRDFQSVMRMTQSRCRLKRALLEAAWLAAQIDLAKAMRKYDLRGLHHVPLVRGESRTLRGCDAAGFITRSDPAPDALDAANAGSSVIRKSVFQSNHVRDRQS